MTISSGKLLYDKYEIVREIKQGGFGVVYSGIDRDLNKPIAIKEIAPGLLEDPKYLDMFQEEAMNIAKLSHHNIVHIYELLKTPGGLFYIIMEYIDGVDLEKVLRLSKKLKKRIPPHVAVYIVAEICMALDYAHHRRDTFTNKPLKLVHLDISPSNIMISRDGSVKLIDFGIALVRQHQKKSKGKNKVRGKVPYLSPEQLIMGNHPDHRSDLYSLGLVLYELLLGQKLFRSREEVIAAAKNAKYIKKVLKGAKIPTALAKIISKCLEVDLAKRYQSANHMYIDLLQYLISCSANGELTDELSAYVRKILAAEEVLSTRSNGTGGWETSDSSERFPSSLDRSDWLEESKNGRDNSTVLLDFEDYLFSEESNSVSAAKLPLNDVEDDEENLKTVIDGVKIYARNNRRVLKYAVLGTLLFFFGLGVCDTIFGWSKVGTLISDWLFPPDIKIVTIPTNAAVSIDGESIPGQTPLSIDQISPGVHKLELSLPGYKPIEKSLFVPREGSVELKGAGPQAHDRTYVFKFSTEIEVDSSPAGATVYFNGIKLSRQTPFTIAWEVGDPLDIQMELSGYERLNGLTINTLEGYEEVKDRRFWHMDVQNLPHKRYQVNGMFHKKVVVETIPEGVEIYADQGQTPVGISGRNNPIYLTAGTHKLLFKKDAFLPKTMTLKIDETFDDKLSLVLSREVRFTAVDERNRSVRDIEAKLSWLTHNGKNSLRGLNTTPAVLTLPALDYTAIFEKEGYETAIVKVAPEAGLVRATMRPARALVVVKVIDAISNQAIRNAAIYHSGNENIEPGSPWLLTDELGRATGMLRAGRYSLTVKKTGYQNLFRNLSATNSGTTQITLKMYPSN